MFYLSQSQKELFSRIFKILLNKFKIFYLNEHFSAILTKVVLLIEEIIYYYFLCYLLLKTIKIFPFKDKRLSTHTKQEKGIKNLLHFVSRKENNHKRKSNTI